MANPSTTDATATKTTRDKFTKQADTKGQQSAGQFDLQELAQTIGALSTYLIIGGNLTDIGGAGIALQYPESREPFIIKWQPEDFAYLVFVMPKPDNLPHGCYVIDDVLQGAQ